MTDSASVLPGFEPYLFDGPDRQLDAPILPSYTLPSLEALPHTTVSVRVYQADSKGGVQFVGEDRIGHTPKDETLKLKIGNAFDVVAERKQVDFQKVATNIYDVEYEVVLRNHKTTPITVEVNEPIGGTWRILRSTHQATKTDAWAAQVNVPVAADGEVKVNYRVRVTY